MTINQIEQYLITKLTAKGYTDFSDMDVLDLIDMLDWGGDDGE